MTLVCKLVVSAVLCHSYPPNSSHVTRRYQFLSDPPLQCTRGPPCGEITPAPVGTPLFYSLMLQWQLSFRLRLGDRLTDLCFFRIYLPSRSFSDLATVMYLCVEWWTSKYCTGNFQNWYLKNVLEKCPHYLWSISDSAQTGLQTEKHNVFCCGRFGIFQQVFQTLHRDCAVHHGLLGQCMLNSSCHTRFCGVKVID